MQVARILTFALLVTIALGDLSASGTTQANTATPFTLSGGAGAVDTALAVAFGGALLGGFGVNVTTNVATTQFSISLGINANAYANANVAGGVGNAATVSLLAALGATSAISLTISATPATTVTLTVKTPAIALTGSSTVQANLFAGFNDASASGTVYGAVAYSVNAPANTITYTIPVGASNQLFFVALDTSLATSASSSASTSSSQSSDNNNPGANNFKYNGKFIPVAYNSDYSLTVGQQYTYGSNIYVTPIGTSGQAAGSLNINYVGTLGNASSSGSASAAPSTAAYFRGYYQISGSANANNVLQWTSDSSNSANLFVRGNAQITAQAFANQYANTATWVKSNTNAGASAAANTWNAVSSSRQSVNGKISVYANVNSYSQWTVAASGNAATVKAGLLIVIVAILAVVF